LATANFFRLIILFHKYKLFFMFTRLLQKVVLVALLLLSYGGAYAQNLELVKSVSTSSPVLTGQTFTYNLQYRCASTTTNCTGVMVTDPLPVGIDYVGATGSVHVTNISYNSGARTVTFTFVDPLAAGSTGTLGVQVRFPNGTTPDGTTVNNQATITATNAATVNSNIVPMEADAIDRIRLRKYVNGYLGSSLATAAIGEPVDYAIDVCNPNSSGAVNGSLTATNAIISDPLPPEAEFVSVSNGGTYDAGTHTVTFNPLTVDPGDCFYYHLIVRYPDANVDLDDQILNRAYLDYDLPGSPNHSKDSSVLITIAEPINEVSVNKTLPYIDELVPNQATQYQIEVRNTGNSTLTGYSIVDVIPAGIEVTQVSLGGWQLTLDDSTPAMVVEYKTNLNGNYTATPDSPYLASDLWTSPSESLVLFPSLLGAGEYVTEIRWTLLEPFVPGAQTYEPMKINFTVLPGTSPGTITNCLTCHVTATNSGAGPGSGPGGQGGTDPSDPFTIVGSPCVSLTVIPASNIPNYTVQKHVTNTPSSGMFVVGDTVEYSFFAYLQIGSIDLINPVIMDLLPLGLDYVPGSFQIIDNNALTPPDIQTFTPNYNGTGRTLIYLEWTNDTLSTSSPQFTNTDSYTFKAVINNLALVSTSNYVMVTGENASGACDGYSQVDVNDLDGDNDTTEDFCFATADINIAASAALESIKEVKGQLDNAYSRYPDVGHTVPGGIADYRLKVWNPGNVPMTNVIVIDILPFVGDQGVIDLSPRNTEWRPYLAGPVTPPSGVTVYYSTASNPCRSAEGIEPSGPAGCSAPNWSTSPPSDITTVQSLKFDFGSIVLNPNDELELNWPMRAPTNAPTAGEIAWNSFGYIAQRTDDNTYLLPSEPIKVGIDVQPLTPAVLGNYVWLDTNQNGIQDDGATGVAGVRVELYQDNGNGVSDPATDTYLGFTVTDASGNYVFPNLSAGNYFVVFYPPVGYDVSPTDQAGDDALDSDGIVTPVTNLMSGEFDLTWDLGIYPTTDCDVNISNYTVSECSYDGTNSTYTLNIFVEWANPPVGEDIDVTAGGQTQTIDVSASTSPKLVSFTLPADGASHTIDAAFASTSSCGDSKTYSAPVSCASCGVQITNVNVGTCQPATSTASLSVTVAWSNEPAGENLEVTANGQTQTIDVSNNTSPKILTFTIPADGSTSNAITAEFAATTSCGDNSTYDAPVGCAACSVTVDSATPSACNPTDNMYSLDVTVTYADQPTGDITINVGGTDYTFTPDGTSPDTYTVMGLISNGTQDIDISATFVGDAACTHTLVDAYDAPANCFCSTNTCLLNASFFENIILGFDGSLYTPEGTVSIGSCTVVGSYDMAMDAAGNIYLTSSGNNRVVKFDNAGNCLGDFITAGLGGLDNPRGLTFLPNGDLLVNSHNSGQILRYDGTTGAYIGVFSNGSDISPIASMAPHMTIKYGPDGAVWVADHSNNRILRFDATTGAFLSVFAQLPNGSGVRSFEFFGNYVLVSRHNADVVAIYDYNTGSYIGDFADSGDGLDGPTGITYGPDGKVYIGSLVNNQILVFDALGTLLTTIAVNSPKDILFKCGECFAATCSVTVDSAIPSTCNPADNTYSLDVTVSYANPPSGDITINVGGTDYTFTPDGTSPDTYTVTGLTANGTTGIDVSATFVGDNACTNTLVDAYDAPASCSFVSLGNYVWHDLDQDGIQDINEAGVQNVGVALYSSTDCSGTPIATTTTSSFGLYEFTGLTAGDYCVKFTLPTGWEASPANSGGDDGLDSDGIAGGAAQEYVIANINLTQNDMTNDLGIFYSDCAPAVLGIGATGTAVASNQEWWQHIAAYNFNFGNVNAVGYCIEQGDEDPTIGDVYSVNAAPRISLSAQRIDRLTRLMNALGDPVVQQSVQENLSNHIIFDAVMRYLVDYYTSWNENFAEVESNINDSGWTPAEAAAMISLAQYIINRTEGINGEQQYAPAQVYWLYNETSTGRRDIIAPASLLSPEGPCAVALASLGNYVWLDTDEDGVQDAEEVGVAGITVTLYDSNGNIVGATVTDAYGYYLFDDLQPGDYSVHFGLPANYVFSPQGSGPGSGTATDSDASTLTGTTGTITLAAGENNMDVDAGIHYHAPSTASLGDYVWLDTDADGIQDAGEVGVSGVVVTLYDGSGNVMATDITDGDGHYLFTDLPAGTYSVGFTLPVGFEFTAQTTGTANGSDADSVTGLTATVTLAAGQQNLDLDAGIVQQPATEASLGDLVWYDLDNDGIQDAGEPGVGGVTVNLYAIDGSPLATTTTNALGVYVFNGLAAGEYYVQFDATTLPSGTSFTAANAGSDDAKDGDVDDTNGPNTTTTITLVAGQHDMTWDAGIYAAGTASLGDYVWYDTNGDGAQDPSESGVQGVSVTLLDSNGNPIASTVTNSEGFYLFPNLTPGTYSVVFGNLPEGYIFTAPNATGDTADSDAMSDGATAQVTLVAGENNTSLDAGIVPGPVPSGTASLGDVVWYDNNNNGIQDAGELGVPNVTVNLYAADNLATPIATVVTGALGDYIFTGLDAGSYVVEFDISTLPNGYSIVTANAGSNDALDSDANTATGQTMVINLAQGEDNLTVDAGIYNPAALGSIGDYVWNDADQDGIQDIDEIGVPGITVTLYDTNGNVLATTTTGVDGGYLFPNLPDGDYVVGFSNLPDGYQLTTQTTGTATGSDPDPNTGLTSTITVSGGADITDVDAGIYGDVAMLGNYVWYDTNGNGLQDETGTGVAGVTVILYQAGVPVASAITGADGFYLFTNLAPGTYSVGFTTLPDGVVFTQQNAGDDLLDSDVDPATGQTASVTLAAGDINLSLDAGLYANPIGSLGDYVWYDDNGNGIQDATEAPVAGTVATLEVNGQAVAVAVTSGSGGYIFDGLLPEGYTVVFSLPTGYEFTTQTTSTATGSDADTATGATNQYDLASGEHFPDLDAGIVYRSLCGYAFNDLNKDGIWNSPTEGALEGVTVYLYDESDLLVRTATTDANGYYSFYNVPAGSYYVQFDETTNAENISFVSATFQNVNASSDITDTNDSDVDPTTRETSVFILGNAAKMCDIDAGFTTVPLPVELLYFRGSGNGCSVELEWATASEEGNDYFVVEHSVDGRNFKPLKVVQGAGNSTDVLNYSTTHDNVRQNLNHYRLKQVDFDGSFAYSEIVSVKTNCYDDFRGVVGIYPNPTASGSVKVKLYADADLVANLEVVDVLGRVVITAPISLLAGNNLLDLDMSGAAPGVYFVKARGAKWRTEAMRLVKVGE
jgi:uncharacterized repeat protein (TIGR01451 family)